MAEIGAFIGQNLPSILAVGGSIFGGSAKNAAGQQNQQALYAQATEEEAAGAAQETRIREQARKAIGEQSASLSANGFQGDSGSALDALTESQINATLDALNVRRQAAAKARALRAEGDIRASEGKNGLISGLIGAGSAAAGMMHDWAAVKRG